MEVCVFQKLKKKSKGIAHEVNFERIPRISGTEIIATMKDDGRTDGRISISWALLT